MQARDLQRIIAGTTAVGLLGLLIWSRLAGLGQSLWHDEIFTVTNYTVSVAAPFTASYVPNNHVLFSVLTAVTVDVLGATETVFRLWAAGPAILSVVLAGWWGWRRFGAGAGLGIGALLVLSPLHLELSRQARGYGLAFLAMAALVLAAAEFVDGDSGRWPVLLLGAAGAIGIMTLPIFVLPFSAIALILLMLTRDRRIVAVSAVTGLVSLLWYAPLLDELIASTGQEFGGTLNLGEVITQPVVDLVEPTLALLVSGAPTAVWVALAYLLSAIAIVRTSDALRPTWYAVATAVVGTYAVLALLGFQTAYRFTSFLVVPAAVLIGLGAWHEVRVGPRWRRSVSAGLMMLAIGLMTASFLPVARQVTSTPRENFAGVAEAVETADPRVVLTNSQRPLGLEYYIEQSVRMIDADTSQEMCTAPAPLVYIEHKYRSPDLDESCLEQRGAQLVRVPQRVRGGHIDVWRLPDD